MITLVTAPGDGEVTVVADETMGEKAPLLAKLLAAATFGRDTVGAASRRQEIRIVPCPDERPVGKGTVCGQTICQTCRAPLRLLSLVKSEAVAKKVLTAMHLSADVPLGSFAGWSPSGELAYWADQQTLGVVSSAGPGASEKPFSISRPSC